MWWPPAETGTRATRSAPARSPTTAFNRIADARTVDPIGIGYKLLATRQWPTDHRKGLSEDLGEDQHDLRSIARIIKDLGVLDHAAGNRPARRIPSRLRPLWDAYQAAWKGVSDAMDEEDAAMVARRKAGAAKDSSEAEKVAEAKRALADKAFAAASDAFEEAPTRTFDDALCKIEFAIDQVPPSDIAAALNDALRVLRKVNEQTQSVM